MRSLLKHPAEWRTLAFMAIFVACSRTLWRCDAALAAAGPAGWLLLLLLWFTLCFFSAIAAVITHNALHVPAFNYAAPQLALQCLLTVAYGQPVSVYLPIHNRSHHRHTGTCRDLMRPQKMPHRWNALNLFTAFLYSPGTGAGVRFLVRFVRAQWRVGKPLVLTWALEASALLITLAVGFRTSWWRGLLYLYVPQMCSQWFITMINFVQHDGCEVDPSHRGVNFARNFTGSWFNFFTLNNGYHTIHHLKPGLHWSVLPAHHARTVKPHIAPSLDVPDFTRFFWRRMWVRDDYLGNPVPPFHHEDDEIVDFATAESFMDDVSVIPSVRRRRSCSPARKKD